MALHAIRSADHIYSYRINLSLFKLLPEIFVFFIKFIIVELNFGIAVTIDTPAHGQIRNLGNAIHLLNSSMAGLTRQFACAHMLRMTEKHMVG